MDWPRLCTTRLLDQSFGMSISPQDILVPFFNNQGTNYYRPWKLCEEIANKDFGSTVDNANDKFRISLDVQHFLPNEVSVKINDTEIIIEGKHEERKDDHGFISRQFVRRYGLPKDCLSESLTSTLSSDGVLTIMANKQKLTKIENEKIIPIKMSGPSRNTEQIGETKKTEKNEMSEVKCDMNNDKSKINNDKSEFKKEESVMISAMNSDRCEMKSDKCEMKSDKCEMRSDKCEMKSDKCQMKSDKCEMRSDKTFEMKNGKCDEKKDIEKDVNKFQASLKEEHSRLLKPELLGEAASGTEKILSESWKETDELLKLISADKTLLSGTSEKLEEALGQCKTAISELKKDKLVETNMTAISETSSTKNSMMSETVEMTKSSCVKASTSEKMSDVVSEIICAELQEAAENI